MVNNQNLILAIALTSTFACSPAGKDGGRPVTPEYDKRSGRLQLLKYDSNGNGKTDMWSYMDGSRVVRVEIDRDEDGKIDRWEYYDANQRIEKIGLSRQNDGKEDAWSYVDENGTVIRNEISTRRDGKVSRIERFTNGLLASAEEDSDGDGTMDKWETYEGERLTVVAFDTHHAGRPDRRLVYGPNGSARVEVDLAGNGRFTPETR